MKHRGYYLEKVFLILTCGEVFLPFEESIIELQRAGISVEVLLAEEICEQEKAANCRESFYIKQSQKKVQALYVTDHNGVAQSLLEAGMAVLGYGHRQNKSEGFAGVKYILEAPEGTPAEYFERVFRRYSGLPWSILETERCYVRESCEEDVEAFYTIYKAPEVTRYTEGLYEHAVSERAYMREYIEKVYAYFEFGVWTVILKESGEIIGRAGISVREGFDMPELGYVLGLPWQGKGLAKEVCEGILKYAKEELEITQLQVLIQEENEASIGLAKRLGFCMTDKMDIEGKEHIIFTLDTRKPPAS
ncbi:MAG: GNAT family N-acetyltransferase [Lachnospiraceae bacterium]|nr:GNAT family N-acetyltransferase [Lachnospiraceae bacterium]